RALRTGMARGLRSPVRADRARIADRRRARGHGGPPGASRALGGQRRAAAPGDVRRTALPEVSPPVPPTHPRGAADRLLRRRAGACARRLGPPRRSSRPRVRRARRMGAAHGRPVPPTLARCFEGAEPCPGDARDFGRDPASGPVLARRGKRALPRALFLRNIMELGHVRSIAVFRALQLGDMLCSVPALRALRAGFPMARITLVGLPTATAFLERYPALLDELLPFPGAPGLPEQPARRSGLGRFYDGTRARRFDLALQLHGSGKLTNAIVARLGGRRMAGFVPSGMPAPQGFVPWPEAMPEPLRYLELTRALGLPDDGPALEFPLGPADHAEATALMVATGLRKGGY